MEREWMNKDKTSRRDVKIKELTENINELTSQVSIFNQKTYAAKIDRNNNNNKKSENNFKTTADRDKPLNIGDKVIVTSMY